MIYVALAAYNEEKNIGPLLADISETIRSNHIPFNVVVVNDGSKDNTLEVLKGFKEKIPLTIVDQANQGFLKALERALKKALEKAQSDDVVITMDADGTHSASLIPRLIAHLEDMDIVIASRFQPGGKMVGVPWYRELLSVGAKALMRGLVGLPSVRDYSTAYRAYRAGLLKEAFIKYPQDLLGGKGFSGMAGFLIRLGHLTKKITEIPFVLRYDLKQGASSMNVMATVKGYLDILWAYKCGRFKPR
jgi:dolichol-phosphate mannosyltransferase